MEIDDIGSLAGDPQDPDTFYVCGGVYTVNYKYQMVIYKSTDAGATWPTEIPVGKLQNSFSVCNNIALFPDDGSIIYAAGTENYNIKAYRTDDGGQNWKDVTGNLSSLHTMYSYVYALWISPDDPDTVVVGTSKGIFFTTDGGSNWSATTVTFRPSGFAYHPHQGTLYASTEGGGIFESGDQGATWQALNNGIGDLNLSDVGLDIKNGWLYAGSGNASVWRLDLPAAPLWTGVKEIPKDTGGSAQFFLNAGAQNGGRSYLLAGSITGTEPGTTLPGGLVTIPLNRDPYTNFILSHLNTNMFMNFSGKLDAEGQATAKLNLPPVPAHGGKVMYYAYCLTSPYDYASNPVEIVVGE